MVGSFLGWFYFFMIIILLVLFFYENKDYFFKSFYFLGVITLIILLIHYSYFQTSIDNEYSDNYEISTIGTWNINAPNFTNHLVDQSDNYHLINVNGFIDIKKEHNIKHARFCFWYNNSDSGENAIYIVQSTNIISDLQYVDNNTFGQACSEINETEIHEGAWLGVNCADCSGINPIYIMVDGTEPLIQEVTIDKNNPLTYSVDLEQQHLYTIEMLKLPSEQVKDNFTLFMYSLFVFSLMFLFRVIFRLVQGGLEY